MKKIIKINIILIVLIFISLTTITFAADNKLHTGNIQIGTALKDEAKGLAEPFLGTIKVIGIFVAIIILMVVGMKYMFGSVEERAEYKQTAIIYIIGAVLVFATPFVINAIYNIFN